MANESVKAAQQIPRAHTWYLQFPFNVNLTFLDQEGRHWRYIVTPTDERYLVEPGAQWESGSLPPEDVEVRDHLRVFCSLQKRIGLWSMFRALMRRPGPDAIVAQQFLLRIRQLCFQSREHRAALLRIAHGKAFEQGLREQLLKMVQEVDASRQRYHC